MEKKQSHKFKSIKSEYDGFKFDSKLEGAYYNHLKVLQRIGDVVFFLRQVPFHLPGNVTYKVDFQVFYSSGDIRFVDVKGMETKDFIRNKKQVESLFPVVIDVVKKGDF